MVTVKTISFDSGNPVEGIKVHIGTKDGISDAVFTDENGEAIFYDYNVRDYATIYINGALRFTGYLKHEKILKVGKFQANLSD